MLPLVRKVHLGRRKVPCAGHYPLQALYQVLALCLTQPRSEQLRPLKHCVCPAESP
jgi:hypothetical protein